MLRHRRRWPIRCRRDSATYVTQVPLGGVGGSDPSACFAQIGPSCRQHRPHLHHQAVVVGDVGHAAGVPSDSQIRQQISRSHDCFGLEQHCRRREASGGPERLRDRVHLGLILAVRPEPLPQEGNGVETQYLDPQVRQMHDDGGEFEQHLRIGPVQIPLPLVERRPHPLAELVVEREASGREVRKDFRQACARTHRASSRSG